MLQHSSVSIEVADKKRTQADPVRLEDMGLATRPSRRGTGFGLKGLLRTVGARARGEENSCFRATAAWLEASAVLVRSRRENEVREGLADFLRQHLAATTVGFLPAAMADEGGGAAVVTLKLPSVGERIVVTRARVWSAAEAELAERVAGMVDAMLESLSQLRAAQRESVTDALTGLLNRRTLDRLLDREVLMAGRHGAALCVSVIDVDRFKAVNDTLGHEAGDAVLREVGLSITHVLRRSDLAFRTGGDEFTVVLPHTTLSQAVTALEKVRRQVSSFGKVTLSVGVAEWKAGTTARAALRAADAAVYTAKRDARDCTRVAA